MALAFGLLVLICVVLIGLHAFERDQWRKERAELIQRLQAPEQAVASYARDQAEQPQPVAPIALDDDQGYEALRLRREGAVPD